MKNYNNKIALTVDIEDWYHTPAITGSDFSTYKDVKTFMKNWDSKYDYLSKPTHKLLDYFRLNKIQATFFIVADVIDNYLKLIDSIVADGHEIGCHGFHHETNIDTRTKKPAFSVNEFEDSTGKAKEKLSTYTGKKVIGYRAPGAYIGEWMFKSLLNLGFEYDSSINPNSFFNKTDFDTSKILSKPYFIKIDGKQSPLIELPWPYFNFGKFKFPTAGGPFLRFFPSKYIATGLKSSIKRGDSIFYLHSIDISDEKLPDIASSNKRRPFYFSTSGAKTFKKFNKIHDIFKGHWTTCIDIVESIKS